jgi:hypothetical protein
MVRCLAMLYRCPYAAAACAWVRAMPSARGGGHAVNRTTDGALRPTVAGPLTIDRYRLEDPCRTSTAGTTYRTVALAHRSRNATTQFVGCVPGAAWAWRAATVPAHARAVAASASVTAARRYRGLNAARAIMLNAWSRSTSAPRTKTSGLGVGAVAAACTSCRRPRTCTVRRAACWCAPRSSGREASWSRPYPARAWLSRFTVVSALLRRPRRGVPRRRRRGLRGAGRPTVGGCG